MLGWVENCCIVPRHEGGRSDFGWANNEAQKLSKDVDTRGFSGMLFSDGRDDNFAL